MKKQPVIAFALAAAALGAYVGAKWFPELPEAWMALAIVGFLSVAALCVWRSRSFLD